MKTGYYPIGRKGRNTYEMYIEANGHIIYIQTRKGMFYDRVKVIQREELPADMLKEFVRRDAKNR